MGSPELDNLVRIGQLKREPPGQRELEGLQASATTRLADAARADLSHDSRFDLAYGAAHALALYALRRRGYRSDSRYLVFQALAHTADLPAAAIRLLAKAHQQRNAVEYAGQLERDERLLAGLIETARALLRLVEAWSKGPPA